MRILVVEDEQALASAVVEVLEREGYAVDLAVDGATASELAAVNDYDLVILDRSIPPPTGLQLLRQWRQQGLGVPVLILTGHSDLTDRVDGLDSGADDYLTKPFRFAELLARVRSLLRRRDRDLITRLAAGDLEMDRVRHLVTVGGKAVKLSGKEFAMLEYFLRRVGEVVSRTELLEHVWNDSFDSFSNVVDVTVHRLRKKIDGDRDAKLLHTVKGVGYVLHPERR